MRSRNIGRAAVTAGLGLALALTTAIPALATTNGSSAIKVTADDSNLTITVPTEIDFAVNSDGTLTAPSPTTTTITNGSAFKVHVASATYSSETGFSQKAASAYGASTDRNSIMTTLTASGGASASGVLDLGTPAITASQWNMNGVDATTGTNVIQIQGAGAVKNMDKDISAKTTIGTVSWTFAAGAAS